MQNWFKIRKADIFYDVMGWSNNNTQITTQRRHYLVVIWLIDINLARKSDFSQILPAGMHHSLFCLCLFLHMDILWSIFLIGNVWNDIEILTKLPNQYIHDKSICLFVLSQCHLCSYKLGGSSPECWLADSCGISDRIPWVGQNMYFYCSNYVGNQFIIAIRHLRVLWYMANIPRLRAVSRHSVLPRA